MYVVALAVAVPITIVMLILSRLAIGWSDAAHAKFSATGRTIIGRRVSAMLGPLLPLWVLIGQPVSSIPEVWAPLVVAAWFVVGLLLVELHSAWLRRASWIAAFEPIWIRPRRRALGGKQRRDADRRLAHLVHVHAANVVVLAAVGVLITFNQPAAAVLAALFLVRYFAYSNGDLEAVVHWNMHCDVLSGPSGHAGRVWEAVVDYLIGPLNGYVPRVYNANHLLVHHWRNAGPEDLHSITPYRRTSLLEFCWFAGKMTMSVMFGSDLLRHRRVRWPRRLTLGANIAVFWFATAILVAHGSVLGTLLVVFAVQHGVTMARTQCVWHGLIPPAAPKNLATSTVLWVAGRDEWAKAISPRKSADPPSDTERVPTPGTDWPFYDNFHLLHHLRPRAHFTEYPDLLRRMADKLRSEQSIILELAAMDTFAFDCWSGRVDRIAAHLITDTAGQDPVEFLTERLQPAHGHRHPVGSVCETPFGARMDRALVRLVGLTTGGR
jgi:hypothetical protein